MATGLPSVAAILPVPAPPPVHRDWAAMGLPEHGWLFVIDQAHCAACDPLAVKPCAGGCARTHDLPMEERVTMGSCAHCDPAPCLEACPADAVQVSGQGVVEVDQELCLGCRFCLDACPNDAVVYIDPYRTAVPPYGIPGYSPDQPTGAMPYTVAKCTFCSGRLMQGEMPVCAEACPERAVYIGNLDRNTATNGVKLIRLTDLLADRRIERVPNGPRTVRLA